MINCSGSKVNVSVEEVGCVCVCGGGGGGCVRGSNCVSKCDSSDMGRALIDFEGVLELDETVDSLREHAETFK